MLMNVHSIETIVMTFLLHAPMLLEVMIVMSAPALLAILEMESHAIVSIGICTLFLTIK